MNGFIWDRCPKSTHVEQETLALATYLASLKFNEGDISFLKIFSELDISPGIFTSKGAEDCDTAKIKLSARKSTEKSNKEEKHLGTLENNILTLRKTKRVQLMKQVASKLCCK